MHHKVNKALLKEIARKWFLNNPVKIAIDFEGQGITVNNCYKLGCVAGPDVSVENLLHEMCHLAEREEHVILQRPQCGWGFSYGKFWQVGMHQGYEPYTDQATMREARTWAYQLSLSRYLNYEADARELATSAVYMNDFFWFEKKHVTDETLGYNAREEAAIDALANIIEQYAATDFTFENFERAWSARMMLLK